MDDQSKPSAFVTGGTGFIGRHLVEALWKRQIRVTCLVRDAQRAAPLLKLGVTLKHAPLHEPDSYADAVNQADTVYHLAGATGPPRGDTYERVNSEGTACVAEACAAATNPPVLVFASSLAANGPSTHNQPVVESNPPTPVSEYGKSKLAAETRLREFADRVPITVLRPPGVFGPYERHMLKLIKAARRGWCVSPVSRDFRYSFLHVTDFVNAMQLAAKSGRRLESVASHHGIYFVAHDEMPTMTQLANSAANCLGKKQVRTVVLPRWLCRTIGWFGDLASLTGLRPLLNGDKMREAEGGSWICSAQAAKRELGLELPASLYERLASTIQWYAEHGQLRA